MSDSSPLANLDAQRDELIRQINEVADFATLRELEALLVGKRSVLTNLQRTLGQIPEAERKDAGALLQGARRHVEERFAARYSELEAIERSAKLESDRLDLGDVVASAVRVPITVGHPNLVASTQRELEDVFVGMGFSVADGPEVESDWYNFEALNIPPAHPSRGMWDTFYVDLGEPETVVLRTHTSPTQIHLMENSLYNFHHPIFSN